MDSSNYPRVLIINYRPLNQDSATGITISNLFADWPENRLAQICVSNIPPENSSDMKFWQMRLEDRPFLFRFGPLIRRLRGASDSVSPSSAPVSVTAPKNAADCKGVMARLKSGTVYLLDMLPYAVSEELRAWIHDFNPELIYSMLEDPHLTRLTLELGKTLNIPAIPHLMDDWMRIHFPGANNNKIVRRRLVRDTEWIIRHAPKRMVIGEAMADEYGKRYGLQFLPFMNCVDMNQLEERNRRTMTENFVLSIPAEYIWEDGNVAGYCPDTFRDTGNGGND